MLNIIDDGIEFPLWEMVAFVIAQIEDTQAVGWTREGEMQFLRWYADGTQALIVWGFGKADFMDYVSATLEQRAEFLQLAAQYLRSNTDTLEKLTTLPAGLRLLGYLPKRTL